MGSPERTVDLVRTEKARFTATNVRGGTIEIGGGDGMQSFDAHCAHGIEANRERIGELMERSLMLVTALAPHIGYDRAAQIAKKAQHEGTTLKQAALALGFVTEQQFNEWIVPLAMTRPGL